MNLVDAPTHTRAFALVMMSASLALTAGACDQAIGGDADPTPITGNLVEASLSEGSESADPMDWAATARLGASDSCEHALKQLKRNVRTEMLIQAEQVRRKLRIARVQYECSAHAENTAEEPRFEDDIVSRRSLTGVAGRGPHVVKQF